ncbi:MAG: hypothetical protein ACI9VO_000268 [Colwellia sp.]|jgi:hypothetical protein
MFQKLINIVIGPKITTMYYQLVPFVINFTEKTVHAQ